MVGAVQTLPVFTALFRQVRHVSANAKGKALKVQIPRSIDDAKERLNGLDRLLIAQGWERAAIVYAFTEDVARGEVGRGRNRSRNSVIYSCAEFAELGIHGLLHHETVRTHRRNWQKAIEKGWAVHIEPGDEVELPEEDYPHTGNGGGSRDAFTKDTPVSEKIEALDTIMEKEPEFAKAVERKFIEKAGKDPALVAKINRTYEEFHPTPTPKDTPSGPLNIARWLGLGAAIYSAVQRHEQDVADLSLFLREHKNELEPRTLEALREIFDDLNKTRQVLTDYEEKISDGFGVDVDDIFRRLTRES